MGSEIVCSLTMKEVSPSMVMWLSSYIQHRLGVPNDRQRGAAAQIPSINSPSLHRTSIRTSSSMKFVVRSNGDIVGSSKSELAVGAIKIVQRLGPADR